MLRRAIEVGRADCPSVSSSSQYAAAFFFQGATALDAWVVLTRLGYGYFQIVLVPSRMHIRSVHCLESENDRADCIAVVLETVALVHPVAHRVLLAAAVAVFEARSVNLEERFHGVFVQSI